jgi:hypothetical protein
MVSKIYAPLLMVSKMEQNNAKNIFSPSLRAVKNNAAIQTRSVINVGILQLKNIK